MKLLDLFAKAIGAANPATLPKPSVRKPQHGHRNRAARRLLGQQWAGPVVHAASRHGDPATTFRVETASERRRRRRIASRCRALGHPLPGASSACACTEVTDA